MIKKKQTERFQDPDDIQNRQVRAMMLQIDWFFAECADSNEVGFADFVV